MSGSHLNSGAPGAGVPGAQRFNRLWIGGLPRNAPIDDIRAEVNRVFSSYGPVVDVCVITTARDVMCFVQYDEDQVAYNAREDMNGKMVLGSVIKVNYAVIRGPDAPRGQQKPTPSTSPTREKVKDPNRKMVFVSNLPPDTTPQELCHFGHSVSYDVSFANVWKEGASVYGLLTFDSARDAQKARRRLDGATVGDHKLSAYSFGEFNDMISISKRKK
jgi:hypothetical protein